MNRKTVIIAAFGLLWALLWLATKDTYDRLLPGVPDSGRWPVASLIWLLTRANTPGRPWDDMGHAAVWLLAVATLCLPILVSMLLARCRAERLLAWFCVAALTLWALYTTFDIQYGYVRLFNWPKTALAAFWFVFEPMLWAGAICTLGVTGGLLVRKMMDTNRASDATLEPAPGADS
jgi:dolichol kinase